MNKFRELDSTRCVAGSLGVCLAIWCACALAACSSSGKIVSWQEEVKLSDGRTIVIKHQERCDKGYSGKRLEHCIAREHWVTLDLPEFAAIPIVWHQSLSPIVVNIDAGKLYVVGLPPTGREDEMLGRPRPPYIGFVWQGGQWKQIAFEQTARVKVVVASVMQPTAVYLRQL